MGTEGAPKEPQQDIPLEAESIPQDAQESAVEGVPQEEPLPYHEDEIEDSEEWRRYLVKKLGLPEDASWETVQTAEEADFIKRGTPRRFSRAFMAQNTAAKKDAHKRISQEMKKNRAESYEALETPEEKILGVESNDFAQRLEGMRRHDPEAEKILSEWEQKTIKLMQKASDSERLGFRIDIQRSRMYWVMGDVMGAIGLLEGILIEASSSMPGFAERAPDLIDRAYYNIDKFKEELEGQE